MVKIGISGRIRLRIRHFLRRSRHRAWRIHWRVTLIIVLLIAITIGCCLYYFNVILPHNLKYSYSDNWDFLYYLILPMVICMGIALKLSLHLLDKQMEIDSIKHKKEWEKIREKHEVSGIRKDASRLENIVIELQEQKSKKEQMPIFHEGQDQNQQEITPIPHKVIYTETEQTIVSVPKPIRKTKRQSKNTRAIYREYYNRENPYNKFLKARKAAVIHIQTLLDNRLTKGLLGDAYLFTTDESDTLFEDFSIVYGNQVIAVQITYPEPYLLKGQSFIRNPHLNKPAEWKWERELFTDLCLQNKLIPCLYEVDPITLQPIDAKGWNLRSVLTEESIIPPRLVTAELTDMSEWELQTQMIQFVREYQQQEEEGLIFNRNSSFWKGNILWMRKKGRKEEWIMVKRVNKFTVLTDKQKERLRYSDFSLNRRKGYLAQIIYKKENTRGGFSPVDHPKRGVNYEMEFSGLQEIK